MPLSTYMTCASIVLPLLEASTIPENTKKYIKFSTKTQAKFGNVRLHYVGYYGSKKFLGKEKTTTRQSKVVTHNGVVYDLCKPRQHQPPSFDSQVELIENGYHVVDHTS